MAWMINDKLSDRIIREGGVNYPWAIKIKQHLIDKGAKFSPLSPKQVREKWDQEGKPIWHQQRDERLEIEKLQRQQN